jgi:uncharacterized membrane protein
VVTIVEHHPKTPLGSIRAMLKENYVLYSIVTLLDWLDNTNAVPLLCTDVIDVILLYHVSSVQLSTPETTIICFFCSIILQRSFASRFFFLPENYRKYTMYGSLLLSDR